MLVFPAHRRAAAAMGHRRHDIRTYATAQLFMSLTRRIRLNHRIAPRRIAPHIPIRRALRPRRTVRTARTTHTRQRTYHITFPELHLSSFPKYGLTLRFREPRQYILSNSRSFMNMHLAFFKRTSNILNFQCPSSSKDVASVARAIRLASRRIRPAHVAIRHSRGGYAPSNAHAGRTPQRPLRHHPTPTPSTILHVNISQNINGSQNIHILVIKILTSQGYSI